MRDKKIIIRRIEITALAFFSACTVIGGILFGYVTSEIQNYSGIDNLKAFQPSVPTRLYDVHGELIAELFQQRRHPVSYDDLPACLINAFLSAEDQDFYDHAGIDFSAILRAMGKNIITSIKAGRPMIVHNHGPPRLDRSDDVLAHCPEDRRKVYAGVIVEILILGREKGVDEAGGQIVVGYGMPPLLKQLGDKLAMHVVEPGGHARLKRLQVVNA